MINKFEKTGPFNVRSGRRKPVFVEEIQKGALQVEKDKASNVHSRTRSLNVAKVVDVPHSTVQSIMQSILRYYPYKFQLVQKFFFK